MLYIILYNSYPIQSVDISTYIIELPWENKIDNVCGMLTDVLN